nr:hypothetical protein [Pseudonocardia sp. AL041005-10]
MRWAARDAAAAGRPLRLVAVSTDPPPLADAGPEVWAELRAATVAAAEDHLRAAAAAVAPLLPPSGSGPSSGTGDPPRCSPTSHGTPRSSWSATADEVASAVCCWGRRVSH